MGNYIENNKLIAEFMGFVNIVETEEMLYNSSWDWLMPVVEKIEAMNINVQIFLTRCTITRRINKGADTETIVSQLWQEHETKIQATYEAVIKFILWHNANPTHH